MSRPSLAKLSLNAAPTAVGDGKRRAIDVRGDSGDSSLDVIPDDLFRLINNYLADPRERPAAFCASIANWCATNTRAVALCADDNTFRLALGAFGRVPPAAASPRPFRDWRDLFANLCKLFTSPQMVPMWNDLRRAAFGHVGPIIDLKTELRKATLTQRQLDSFWDALAQVPRMGAPTAPGGALVRLLELRQAGRRTRREYADLDDELYLMLRRLMPRAIAQQAGALSAKGPLDWSDEAVRNRIKELLDSGAAVEFDGISVHRNFHVMVPMPHNGRDDPGWSPDDAATLMQLVLMTQNAELHDLVAPYAVEPKTAWDDNDLAALSVFVQAPDADARHVRIVMQWMQVWVAPIAKRRVAAMESANYLGVADAVREEYESGLQAIAMWIASARTPEMQDGLARVREAVKQKWEAETVDALADEGPSDAV